MLAMLVYGLGTVPALVALGFGASALSPAVRARFFRFGAALVSIVGLQLFLRGLSSFGVIGHLRIGELVLW